MSFKNRVSILDLYTPGIISKTIFFFLGIVLLSISSKVSIPFYPVPMTLQTFVVYFIAATLGIVGFYSTLSYVILGLIGLPIFAAGGGFSYILSPTFGFLYGMILGSFVIAYMSREIFQKKLMKIILAIFAGAVITFICGITHLSFFTGFTKAIMFGLKPFLLSEILKIALAIALTQLLISKK